MNIQGIIKLVSAWNNFKKAHPNVVNFIDQIRAKGVEEGMGLAVLVTYPDDDHVEAGVYFSKEDLELLYALRDMK